MRNTLTVLLFLLCWGVSSVQGQTALEKAVKRINVSVNMPSFFNASQNEEFIGVVEVTEKDPLPTLAQNYGFEPAYGNTAIGVIFGGVDAILEHKDGDYLVIVYVSPGRGGGKYGDIITDSTVLYTLNNLSFSRIKKIRYGKQMEDASEWEADELYSMLTHYPREQAQKKFNANVMVMYPVNLRGNIYRDKFTRSKAVVVAKDRLEIYLYFMMTDESAKNFDTYVKDLDKVFWFNE